MGQGKIKKNQIAVKDPFGNLSESAKLAKAEVKVLELTLKAVISTAKKLKSSMSKGDPLGNKGIKERNKLLKESNVLVKAKVKTEKQLEAARKSEIRESIKSKKALLDNANAFKVLNKQVTSARNRFKRLAAQHGVNSIQARRAAKSYTKLNAKLLLINRSSRKAGGGLSRFGSALKGGLAAIGIISGVALIARAFRDITGRIREFDAEMRNLAGISGLTLKELQSTKEEINRVAGASTKTSGEVAKLATTLFALGKSQSEVNKLLKPVNDLSIALGATSEEAGELLVSTLNAFQKGADQGQHFADVIAKMRTSTSLDFERIKDSLGFVSATASVLNLTIGETGALIGVLQDNGVKAARAGRLLNSSFIKLAKEGKTLEGSLNRINKAQERGAKSSEILRIAEKDFGTQSASLGVILASNRDQIAELSNEFDNLSEGSLKKLTDEQLKSLNSQLKITESTWESLVLSIESGDGAISSFFKNALSGLNKFLVQLRRANQTFSQNLTEDLSDANKEFISGLQGQIADNIAVRKKGIDEELRLLESRKNRGIISEKAFNDEKKKLSEDFDKFSDGARNEQLLKEKEFLQKTIAQQTKGTDVTIDNAEAEVERLLKIVDEKIGRVDSRDSNFALVEKARADQKLALEKKGLADSVVINKDRIRLIELLLSEQEELNEVEKEEEIIIGDKKKSVRTLTGLIELQAEAVSDLSEKIKRATSEDDIVKLGFELDVEKDELDRLKTQATGTFEEIQKIELNLIEDTTQKRIAKEKEKAAKIIQAIKDNKTIEGQEELDLIRKVEIDRDKTIKKFQVKELQDAIKHEADLSRAEIEQRKAGFKSEEDFEEFKSEQFIAIKRNELEEQIKVLERSILKEDKLKAEQLKGQLNALDKFNKDKSFFTEKEAEDNAKALQLVEDIAVKNFDASQDRLTQEEQKSRSQLDEFKQAARDGNITAKESLAEQQRLADEAALKQQELEQKKQNFLLVTAVLQAFNSELTKTDDVGQALTTAITSTTVLSQFAAALPAFLDGVETTGSNGRGVDGKGGFHAILHPDEGVLQKELNDQKLAAGLTNKEMVRRAVGYEALVEKNRLGSMMGDTQLIAMANGVDLSRMEAELKDIKKAIIDKPETKIELGQITQASMEIVERKKVGNRTTINRFKVKAK